ncbi:TIM21-domain-containing protein [Irpex rosettiformis]|uniref:TIM21-domain-containing protein n=1 Tax=Irpex rosettiformis TaxID=378272 RepID=A0ACB8UKC5_9APHY|nr:TIM21-domain-containing protein [Irpex rosettiformis]
MNLHCTRVLLGRQTATIFRQHASLANSSRRRTLDFAHLCRTYATHKDQPISKQSPLLTHTLDQQRAGVRQRDSVGPFQLGLIPPTPKDGASQKKWSELSTGGKVVRSTARMSNLFVILFGAGFTAVLVYALTSELFSKNSATVLYGQACELIKSSPNVTQYFRGPLVFHNNPPSALRPRHRNDRVTSQSGRDTYGRETLLLNFYVEAKRRSGNTIAYEDQTWWESASEWTSQRLATVSDTTPEQAWESTKEFANEKWERAKRLFRFLNGDPVPATRPSAPAPTPEVKEVKEESGWKSSFTGLFSGLRGASREVGESLSDSDNDEGYTEGEVQAMLVMLILFLQNDNRQFEFRYLRIDVPGEPVS